MSPEKGEEKEQDEKEKEKEKEKETVNDAKENESIEKQHSGLGGKVGQVVEKIGGTTKNLIAPLASMDLKGEDIKKMATGLLKGEEVVVDDTVARGHAKWQKLKMRKTVMAQMGKTLDGKTFDGGAVHLNLDGAKKKGLEYKMKTLDLREEYLGYEVVGKMDIFNQLRFLTDVNLSDCSGIEGNLNIFRSVHACTPNNQHPLPYSAARYALPEILNSSPVALIVVLTDFVTHTGTPHHPPNKPVVVN